MADAIRNLAREALDLHHEGKHAEALEHAYRLSSANPNSALAHNLVGVLHFSAGGEACAERLLGGGGDEYPSESNHFRAALAAFSVAASKAPNCILTAVAHAEALNAQERFAEAQKELLRVLLESTTHLDPAVNNGVYNLHDASNANARRIEALRQAAVLLEETTSTINLEVVPREAAKMLGGDDQLRERAKVLSETYPYSAGANLLRAHIELEEAHALHLSPVDRRRLLRRSLELISRAAGTFDSSLLIALFHAKVLFALDQLGESRRECKRALSIVEPTDPGFEDIPPAVCVPGSDYKARVSSVKRQLQILLKQIAVVAAVCWSSTKSTQQSNSFIAARGHNVTSLRVDKLQDHCDEINNQAAKKNISDAMRFLHEQNSWTFLICPNSSCDDKKFLNAGFLWEHICSEHRAIWNKLQSVLGPDLNECAKENDPSLDVITLSQDSEHDATFNLQTGQDVFEDLLLSPSTGIKLESFDEMRRRKCREGAEVLEDIKEKFNLLPWYVISTEEVWLQYRLEIGEQWLKLFHACALDYREVVLPLARSFQKLSLRIQVRKLINLNTKDLSRIIGGANIEKIFSQVPQAPDKTAYVDHHPKPSHDSSTSTTEGTSGQPVNELTSISNCQESLNFFNKNTADKDLSILSLIIRLLCNLENFRDKFLTEPLEWTPSVENISIAQQFYEIFMSWEQNDHHLPDAVLNSVKNSLSRVDYNIFSEKAGTNFASEIVATILIGLHMSETSSRFTLNKEAEKDVVNPITRGVCMCPTHNLFGIKFDAKMSCKCGKWSGKYSALFHKLDAGSSQITKIQSFAELPVLLDEQFCKDNTCEDCGTLLNTDLFLSNTPHFFAIVLNWLGTNESQDTLSEVLAGITSPVDTGFFCKSADSSTLYAVTSMICYADESYVCFARNDEDKWLIYGFETVETEDTWEHLLERFKDCKLQPEVLFFEVIK